MSRLFRTADSVVAVSSLATTAGARVIGNAVDPDRLAVRRRRKDMRRAWGVPPGAKVAGYLGRFAPEKGVSTLPELAQALPPGWVVVAIGAGGLRPELEGKPRLLLPGPDLAAGDCLNAFDLLVSPSIRESFGLSMAEAMWAGVPVIATDQGIAQLHPELVRHARPNPDRFSSWPRADDWADAFARAIRADRADPDGTLDRVRRARAFAREHFSPERFGRDWTDLIAGEAPLPRRREPERAFLDVVLDRVELCPFAEKDGPCGCGNGPPRICRHPDRPDRVRRDDCLGCVARDQWEHSVA